VGDCGRLGDVPPENKLWGYDDPLFPATRVALGANRELRFRVAEGSLEHSLAIRKIFRDAFTSAGLQYFNPHSFRNTLVQLGQKVCKSPEQFKAWSQNLGHEKTLTTFLITAKYVPASARIMRDLAIAQPAPSTPTKLRRRCSRNCATRRVKARAQWNSSEIGLPNGHAPSIRLAHGFGSRCVLKVKQRSLLLWVRQGKLPAYALSSRWLAEV